MLLREDGFLSLSEAIGADVRLFDSLPVTLAYPTFWYDMPDARRATCSTRAPVDHF